MNYEVEIQILKIHENSRRDDPEIDVVFPEDTLTTAAQLMARFEALPVSDVQRGLP
jgi:hypothetical protein